MTNKYLTKSEELAKELAEYGLTDLSTTAFRKRMGGNGISLAEEEYLIEKVHELQNDLKAASHALAKTLANTRRIAELEAQLAATKLPRGNGLVPVDGEYWIKIPQGWTIQYTHKTWVNPSSMDWAGPIPKPEEEK